MFGIKSRHIAALLDIANDISDDAGVVADSDRNKRELLKQRLKRCMTQDILAVRAILDNDHDILESIGSLTNKRVIDLLLDEHTSLDLFRYLKQYAAELSRSAENEAERQTANVIYYASIAGSLTFHQEKITDFAFRDLANAFSKLKQLDWIVPELMDHFQRAYTLCKTSIGLGKQ